MNTCAAAPSLSLTFRKSLGSLHRVPLRDSLELGLIEDAYTGLE